MQSKLISFCRNLHRSRHLSFTYREADVLNIALFGMAAKQWSGMNPDKKGNVLDYANINELICLSNMENINAVLIEDGLYFELY